MVKDIGEILKEIINDYGVTVYKNQNRFEALLRDYLEGENKKEIIALMLTLEEGIADKIAETKDKNMLDTHIKLLCDTTPTSEKMAAWAVGVWYYSFGILGKEDISSYEDDIKEDEIPVNINHKETDEIHKFAYITAEQVDTSYKILNLNNNANIEQVMEAYKGLVKKYNPSKFSDESLRKLAEQKTRDINYAKEVLNKYLYNIKQLNMNSPANINNNVQYSNNSNNGNINNNSSNSNISNNSNIINKNSKSIMLSAGKQYNHSRKIKICGIIMGIIFSAIILFLIINTFQAERTNVSSQTEKSAKADNSKKNMSDQGKEKPITSEKQVDQEVNEEVNQEANEEANKDVNQEANQVNSEDNVSSKSDNEDIPDQEEKPITFKNKVIELAVRREISKPSGDITKADIEVLTKLNLSYYGISDISDLKQLTNLTEIELVDNKIRDISPLASLTKLDTLSLNGNGLTNIRPLTKMTNLLELDLGDNKIQDISPLTSLTDLSILNLSYNGLTNISLLAKMTNLTELYLQNNKIQNISPLISLINLNTLDLNGNGLTNISPLSKITSLEKLDLSFNHICNIKPLSNLTGLTYLKLTENQIADMGSLGSLSNLRQLYISDNPIKDFSALKGMGKLEDINYSSDQSYEQIRKYFRCQTSQN